MESVASESPATSHVKSPQAAVSSTVESTADNTEHDAPSKVSPSGLSSWAKNLKIPQLMSGPQNDSSNENSGKSNFSRFTSGLALRLSPKASPKEENTEGTSTAAQSGLIGTLTKGIVDSSKNAVKAVQVKARHVVSQNKRRYQDDGFDLDMTYITENIIAMGFPAGDMSSGFFGYVEGFYRNHMEEVIKFFETHHKDKYKVYNLCSERLYDASLFEGKVASFPFDDHNCPPVQLIISFCQSAYSWLKEDIENVVVVHCKAGMARTGLMISSLLLYLKFFPTAEESIVYYNQKRCFDGKALVLPSQIRYVKYFERTLTYFNGENQPDRRCMLRGFRLHRCPYWIRPSITVFDHNGVLFSTKKHPRTKDLSPEDFWFSAPKKGIMVFALPGEPGLTEVTGDFKIQFHDRQGDFYCWLNATMTENRKVLNTNELDGFDKRKLPSPGFQVEIVLADFDSAVPAESESNSTTNKSVEDSGTTTTAGPSPGTSDEHTATIKPKDSESKEKDDVFSDSEADETESSKNRPDTMATDAKERNDTNPVGSVQNPSASSVVHQNPSASSVVHQTQRMSISEPTKGTAGTTIPGLDTSNTAGEISEFKAMAADASVFSFGDEDDYESE